MKRFIKKLISIPLAWLIFVSVSGCGFHLRGMVDMPQWLENVAIIQEGQRILAPFLQDQLEAYKINVVSQPSLAKYWLIIETESFQQQITSISSSTTPRQYQLIYTVHFKLQTAQGRTIIPSSPVIVTRQLTVNSDRILGSDEEEVITRREMRRDAIIQILNRISKSTT